MYVQASLLMNVLALLIILSYPATQLRGVKNRLNKAASSLLFRCKKYRSHESQITSL